MRVFGLVSPFRIPILGRIMKLKSLIKNESIYESSHKKVLKNSET